MDASRSGLAYLALGFLLIVSAVISAAETALFAANRHRLRQLGDADDRRALLVLRLLEDPGRLLTSLLAGDTLANIAASVVGALLALRLFGPAYAALYAFVAMAVLLIVIGELVPKALAARSADRTALQLAPLVAVLGRVLSPVIRVLALASTAVVLPLRGRVTSGSLISEEEIRLLVKRGEEEGVIEQDERKMIHSIFEFGDTVAREVMVPRMDMTVLEDSAAVQDAIQVVLESGHSRLPVFHESIDHIVGILYHKDLLLPLMEGRMTAAAREFARPAYYVPETKPIDELLREMQHRKMHLAIVVDEYGGTSGLVTLEDLLEEIVGPILDEHEEEERMVEIVTDRVALVDGRALVEEVNEALQLALPVEEVDTISGFVYRLLGHVPAAGERVDYDGLELIVEQVEGQRITKVKITRTVPTVPAV